jgi:hypothetical protein
VVARGSGAVTVTATDGTSPTYSWSGGQARSLTVLSASGEVFWQVETLDLQAGFPSPARHGVSPIGSRIVVAGRPLQPGVVHTVTVVSVGGTQGLLTFTPTPLTSP